MAAGLDTSSEASRIVGAWPPTSERIAAEWEATASLPPDERERARDILAIKYGPEIRAAAALADFLGRRADARTKLPRREG